MLSKKDAAGLPMLISAAYQGYSPRTFCFFVAGSFLLDPELCTFVFNSHCQV